MRKNLMLVRERVDNLNVKAPMDGQLGLLEVEIGQSVAGGGRIGQISVLSDYKIEALSGLEPGEQVVTSGYDNYGDVQELIF